MTFVPVFSRKNLRADLAALTVVLSAAAVVIFSGLDDRLCIEGHEAFVARTADCMLAEHRFLVPVLDGAPRLNKPPLNYWLAILADRLVRPDGHVSPFEARLPSALGGLLMAGFVFAIGRLLFDRWTGLLAGLATASSFGLAGYSHSAIPEMLYGGLCTAGLAAFLLAERIQNRGRHRAGNVVALGGWGVMGLAALAKGPQVPAAIVLGLWLFYHWESGWRVAFRKLQIQLGVPVFLAAWGWWVLYVAEFVPQARALLGGQMYKHWLPHLPSLWRWAVPYPYFPIRAATLAAPWMLPYALAFAAPWLPGLRGNRDVKRLWGLWLVAMLMFSIPAHRRWYYLLPVLGIIVLLSMTALRAWAHSWGVRHPRGWRALLALHAVGFAVAALALAAGLGRAGPPVLSWRPAAALAAVCLTAAVLVHAKLPASAAADAEIRILILLGCGVLVVATTLASGRLLANPDAAASRRFALGVVPWLRPGDRLYSLSGSWKIAQYYLRRNIRPLDPAQVRRTFGHGQSVWLLLKGPDLPGIEIKRFDLSYDIVFQTAGRRLLRLRPHPPPESHHGVRPGAPRASMTQ